METEHELETTDEKCHCSNQNYSICREDNSNFCRYGVCLKLVYRNKVKGNQQCLY